MKLTKIQQDAVDLIKDMGFDTETLDLTKNYFSSKNEIKHEGEVRFIFILPHELMKYIKWKAKQDGIFKAEVVREAVETQLYKDRDYLRYLKEE
jgi:hypothetical protein